MFDVNREDKPVIQSIALVDQLDKDINSFCMRIKEWFGWHFPELAKVVPDNAVYTKIVALIENKERLLAEYNNEDSELKNKIIEIVVEPELADRIYEAARSSMGSELNEIDALNIANFCEKVNSMINYREGLGSYLKDKMKMLAPNTSTLIGETLGARLVSHAGSLSNLAKYPASTVQILGAEKALFRALKARNGKTPKYGLLYYSNYIGKAAAKNKGKISRYLANKIAQTTKLDFFSSNRESCYGEEFKKQVEERLNFLITGEKPRKNVDAMKEASNNLELKLKENDEKEAKNKKKKDKKKDTTDDEVVRKASVSKKKEEKKLKKEDSDEEDSEEEERKRKQAKKDKKKNSSI
jgi:nucleolar protein 56